MRPGAVPLSAVDAEGELVVKVDPLPETASRRRDSMGHPTIRRKTATFDQNVRVSTLRDFGGLLVSHPGGAEEGAVRNRGQSLQEIPAEGGAPAEQLLGPDRGTNGILQQAGKRPDQIVVAAPYIFDVY